MTASSKRTKGKQHFPPAGHKKALKETWEGPGEDEEHLRAAEEVCDLEKACIWGETLEELKETLSAKEFWGAEED